MIYFLIFIVYIYIDTHTHILYYLYIYTHYTRIFCLNISKTQYDIGFLWSISACLNKEVTLLWGVPPQRTQSTIWVDLWNGIPIKTWELGRGLQGQTWCHEAHFAIHGRIFVDSVSHQCTSLSDKRQGSHLARNCQPRQPQGHSWNVHPSLQYATFRWTSWGEPLLVDRFWPIHPVAAFHIFAALLVEPPVHQICSPVLCAWRLLHKGAVSTDLRPAFSGGTAGLAEPASQCELPRPAAGHRSFFAALACGHWDGLEWQHCPDACCQWWSAGS